jgi:hypothetical protein
VDSNGPQPSDLIPLIRRRNCVRGALNRKLFNSISRSLVSDVPLSYRHCRDLHPRRQRCDCICRQWFTKGGFHFSTCIPPRWSHAMRFMLARETRAAVSIIQHPVSVLTHGSEPVLTVLSLRRSRLEAMSVWRRSGRRRIDEIVPQSIPAWCYCRLVNRATMINSQ